jgi:hypothetical protein
MGENRTAYRLLAGKQKGKRPLGRPRCQMDLVDIGWGGVDWIDVAQGRNKWRALANVIMNLWVQ